MGRGVEGKGSRHKLAGSDSLKRGTGPKYVAHVVNFSPFALAGGGGEKNLFRGARAPSRRS